MKKIFILLLLTSCFNILFASSRIDDLEKKLEIVVAEEKIKVLNELSEAYWYIQPEKSIDYGKRAVILAKKLKDTKQKDRAYNSIATAYAILRDYEKSIVYWQKSLNTCEKSGNVPGIVSDIEKIAEIYINWNKFEKSIEYYNKALKIYEFKNDNEGIARSLNNIGKVYKESGKYDTALEYFLRALKFEEENVRVMMRDDYLHYSEVYGAIGKEDKALEYYKLYTTMKDTIESEKRFQKISDMQKRYEEEKQQRMIELLQKDKEIKELELRQLLLEREKKEKEYEAEKKQRQIEILNKDKAIRDLELRQARYEKDKIKKKIETFQKDKEIKDLELAKKEIELSKQKTVQRYYYLLGALILLFAAISLNQARSLSKANKQLEKANDDLEKANIKLELIAKTDPLTNLSNRRDMIEKIEHEQKRFGRNGKPFILVMSDIDYFKSVNDRYGHDGGDFVLESIAKLMQSVVRKQDIVGRWGGEEFLILLPETDLEGGRALAEKIRKNISITPYVFSDKKIPITMTFGVSVYNKPMDLDLCIKKADEALYKGKKRGKNCVVLSKPEEEEPRIIGVDSDISSR
ncbi:MAG: GGDEF domain-containing protein [Candidatus Cloacimonetes bacterium]|nr:GGDEF domain-containing protein [Candidatus Cloacimonadota bacterium]